MADRLEVALDEVTYRVETGVAVITLAAPARRNALSLPMCRALLARIEEAENDPTVGALVLAGEGATFCAGAERSLLAEAYADPARDDIYQGLGLVYRTFNRLQSSALPTVAAVNGAVAGAGANLTLSCDVRIVADDLRVLGFGVAGIHPGGGHLRLMQRAVGIMGAAAVALFNQELNAESAVATGFAWSRVPRAELEQAAIAFAAQGAKDPALSRQITATWRLASNDSMSGTAATQLERGPQLWSLRRRHQG